MAIYHANAKVISRSGTRCAMSYAAYICGEKATDDRTGMSFDYRKKGEVAYKNIMTPKGMEHLNTTEKLWNAIENCEDKIAEKRYGNYKDAVKQARSLAAKEKFLNEASITSTWEVSLPKELTLEENKELVDRLAYELFGSKNLVVQYALHNKKDNPHVHFASNFRQVVDGEFSKSKYRFSRAMVKEMRHSIANTINDYAKEKGYDFAVDHRSYLSRGIDIEPTKHRGWYASELGDNSRIVLENREILSLNTASLLKEPEELIKVLIDGKTVFNLDELKKSAKERFGTDEQTWHVLKELITKDNAEILIDRAAKFGSFLEVAKEVKEISLEDKESLNADDIAELKELKDTREKLADEIFKELKDYKWLMSKVGMGEGALEAMTSSGTISWNDRSEFLGGDVPKNLRAGDTLSALSKSFGAKELDKGLTSVFNLESLGESFKGKDAYIANSDLEVEEKIIEAKSALLNREFGSELNPILFSNRLKGYRGETRAERIKSIISKQEEEQGYSFSGEQKEAAISLVAGKAYGSLIGKAGTGKTTTLRSVAEFYKKEGYRVIGTSFQGAATGELNDSLGKNMDAGFTLSKLNKEWRKIDKGEDSSGRVDKYELTDKTVVILDEAGMASRGLLKPLFKRALQKGAKVIVVGDSGQISAIDRADVSRLLFDGGSELTGVVRQRNNEDIKASNYFANGESKKGIESYDAKGQLVKGETDFSAKLKMVHDVSEKIARDGVFNHMMIAYKNSDVEDLNLAMQRVRTSQRLEASKNNAGENNIEEREGITVLTGFASSTADGSLERIVSSSEIQKELSEIRGNIMPIKNDKTSISYNEGNALLARLDKGGDDYKLLTDVLKPKTFYIGDKVRFTNNFNKGVFGEKVYNGSLGVISSYDKDSNSLIIEREGKKNTEIELESYSSVQLGYAITINGSQGKTVEQDNHLFLSNTKGAKIGSRESYVGFTRHKENLMIYTSKEYLDGIGSVGGIKFRNPEETQLYQKIEERWKLTADDFVKDNPDLQVVRDLEKLSNEKHKLWSLMQKDVRAGKHDLIKHPRFAGYKQLKLTLKQTAEEANKNWGNVRVYASHANITLKDIKRWSEAEVQIEENKGLTKYREHKKTAQELWVGILKSKKTTPAKHEQYPEFKKASNTRNELAYKLASFGAEQEIHNRDGGKTTTHIFNHLEKNEWSNITKHSEQYIKSRTGFTQGEKKKEVEKRRIENNSQNIAKKQELYQAQKQLWDSEHLELKDRIKYRAEVIARDLLGEPNNKLSNKNELRYGNSGKLAVTIKGEKAGTWYNFESAEGGDMFRLAQDTRYGNFKNSAEYLRSMVGMTPTKEFKEVVREKNQQQADEQEKQEQAKKAAYVEKLYERTKIIGGRTIACRYLKDTRGIDVSLSGDVKTTGIYNRENKEYLPALVAFARDKDGNITGGQHILLNKDTGGKAGIDVPKKSFGKISGAFVDLGNTNTKANKNNAEITIIAEGVETGLSVKQALSEHGEKEKNTTSSIEIKTLCSLGIGNIKNYAASKGEKLIIAADNDGKDSITDKTIKNARSALEEKGAFVEVVKPEMEGDFNDVLKQDGASAVAKAFEPSILKQIERVEVGQEEQKDNPAKDRGGSSRSEMKRKFRESENIFKVRMEEARRENEAKVPKNNKEIEAEAPITQRDIDKAMQSKSDSDLSFSKKLELRKNMSNLQSYGTKDELREALGILKESRGITEFSQYSRKICEGRMSEKEEAVQEKLMIPKEAESLKSNKVMEAEAPITQRDIDKAMQSKSDNGLSFSEIFDLRKNMSNLQSYGTQEELREALGILKGSRGITEFSEYSRKICSSKMTQKINKDFANIKNSKSTELLGSKYDSREKYLIAISKDENIMKHIKPTSEIGKEITKLQELEKNKSRGFDFER